MTPLVFKTSEISFAGLVGSIPIHLRHQKIPARNELTQFDRPEPIEICFSLLDQYGLSAIGLGPN